MIRKIKKEINNSRTFISFSLINILGQGAMFIVPLIIAKILSPEGFGSYSLSMMIIFFFTSALISSSQTPFIVYANEENKRDSKINKAFSIQLIFLIISIIFFIVLTFLFSKYITNFTKISSFQLVFLFFGYLGIGLNSFVQNIFLALNKKISYSLFFLLNGIINLIFIFIVYLNNNLNLNSIFLIYFISSIISIIIFLKQINLKVLLPFVVEKKLFFEMFQWTKWQIMGLTMVYFINWGDNLVLRYFVSMEEIGTYNLGYQIFKGLISLSFILNSYYIPMIIQNIDDKEKIKNYLFVTRPKILLIGISGLFLLYLIIPNIFGWIYGDTYKGSISIIRILILGNIIALYTVFYTPILNSLKKFKFYQMSNIIHIFINILLDIILVPRFGISGAAVATVFGYICKAIMFELYIYIKMPENSLFHLLLKKNNFFLITLIGIMRKFNVLL